jgi:hypothetical protein
MRTSLLLRAVPLVLLASVACLPLACDDNETRASVQNAGGAGGGGGAGGEGGEPPLPELHPGELCADENPRPELSATEARVFVAVGQSRTVKLLAQPDVCVRVPVEIKLTDGSKAQIGSLGGAIPAQVGGASGVARIDLRHPTIEVEIKGVAAGQTTLEASFTLAEKEASISLPIEVLDTTKPSCTGSESGKVTPGGKLGGSAALKGAFLGLQERADQPAQTVVEGTQVASPTLWKVEAFDATVSCGADIVPEGYTALGSAVTFGPEAKRFPRELPMAIPINPALLPEKATMRHVRVAYSGPAFKKPRLIPVADMRLEQAAGGGWVLSFLAPRLGTYQAVIAPDAGTRTFKRKLTHKALIGVSMGGGGTAMFGMRHHDKFDVLAPLGGPVDWTYMLDHIEKNHVAGFLPNDGENPPQGFAPLPVPRDPYEHPSSFNAWWYEYPREGNGGSFSRGDYTQIFRDLALMYGNPNGENKAPNAEHLAPGIDPNHPAVRGDLPDGDCSVVVEATGKEPNAAKLKELQNKCGAARCKHTQVLEKFYDGRFNPKGKWPVITFCDGGPQDKSKSPYSNQWTGTGNSPLDLALAVDYNGNGQRDLNEPVIIQGHEPWSDVGEDGVPSSQEPGYQPGVNEDPAGDDYDPQYNPTGTENDGRYQQGEPFEDVGLDGVADTKDSPYDIGEGDGKFTASKGLQNFWNQDAHSAVRQWSTPPAGPLDDKALKRLDLWVDGGYRDLFNFATAGQHLAGTYAARGRTVAYYSRPPTLPGQNPDKPNLFSPENMFWDHLPSAVLMRYGAIDPTKLDLDEGVGQHVGNPLELTARLQSSIYYISQRWPDAPRTLVDKALNDPAPGASDCEIKGACTFEFKDSRGRVGPVAINLPPGYAHKDQQNERYPVIYMLHGYGQSPEDLSAAIIFLGSWMNQGLDSSATRLGKAILVYVDGRCRLGPDGSPECIRGTFYADSPRATGGKLESWFLDLMTHIDKTYRTMGESEVDWPED